MAITGSCGIIIGHIRATLEAKHTYCRFTHQRQSQSEPNTGLRFYRISLESVFKFKVVVRFGHTIHKYCESVKIYLSD